jgi:S-DNA-T family DNA segregation ATPase FtsK/SpoIIIE
MRERWKEIAGILMLAVAAYLFLSLISFRLEDIPFYSSKAAAPFRNWAGKVGAYTAFLVYLGFGLTSFLIPIFVFLGGVSLLK